MEELLDDVVESLGGEPQTFLIFGSSGSGVCCVSRVLLFEWNNGMLVVHPASSMALCDLAGSVALYELAGSLALNVILLDQSVALCDPAGSVALYDLAGSLALCDLAGSLALCVALLGHWHYVTLHHQMA